ncbi:MAG: hypothetical protein U0Q18_01405 [Bryobacteraceae bacterium]
MPTKVSTKHASATLDGTLHIHLAGIMAFVTRSSSSNGIDPGWIQVLIPNIQRLIPSSNHAYKLVAKTGPAGSYTLTDLNTDMQLKVPGQPAPTAGFQRNLFVHFSGPLSPSYTDYLQCSLLLPPPSQITPVRVINNVEPDWFVKPADGAVLDAVAGHQLAMGHILTYRFSTFDELAITTDKGRSLWAPDPTTYTSIEQPVNIHIFAEPRQWPVPGGTRPYVPYDAVADLLATPDMPFGLPGVTFLPNPTISGMTEDEISLTLPELYESLLFTRPINCAPALVEL